MSKRKDVHRPSVIVPADYEYVAFEYIAIGRFGGDILADCEFLNAERATIRRHMERTGGTYSRHEHGGNCHICGAGAVYTVLFYHAASNSYVRTGQDCAEKLEFAIDGDYNTFRTSVLEARELQAGKRKALDTLETSGLQSAWPIYISTFGTKAEFTTEFNDQPKEEQIVLDIVGKLVKYGSVSDKTLNYLRTLLDKISRRAETEAQRQAQTDAAAPVPAAGRFVIEGLVLTTRKNDTPYGVVTKMLVQHDTGWKVWGSAPSKLEIKRGDRIRFSAKVEISKDDPKFGYFSRPTSGEVVTSSVQEISVAA